MNWVCVLWKAGGGARGTNRRRQIMCGERGMLTQSGARVFCEREGRGSKSLVHVCICFAKGSVLLFVFDLF